MANTMVIDTQNIQDKPTISWEPLPADFIFPDDAIENIQQPALAAALTDALGAAEYIQPEMLIGSNLALVATIDEQIVIKAPDWFYVPQVNPLPEGKIRRSYTPNLDGAGVAVVMEFLTKSDAGELSLRSFPPYGKLYFYKEVLQVSTYITYDPYAVILHVWTWENGSCDFNSARAQERLWVPELELYLGIWQGERLQQRMNWLRWWDKSGNLLLWSAELVQQERQKSERLAAKLRELGIDPDLPD